MTVDTCAFLPCEQADHCCLPGGRLPGECVRKQARFKVERSAVAEEAIAADAPALNGTKPSRLNRDPATQKRKRKVLPFTR
jgi:hypothetical protein